MDRLCAGNVKTNVVPNVNSTKIRKPLCIVSTRYWLKQFRSLNRSLWFLSLPEIVSWRRQWHPTPVLWPGKSHGWRSLVAAVHGTCHFQPLSFSPSKHSAPLKSFLLSSVLPAPLLKNSQSQFFNLVQQLPLSHLLSSLPNPAQVSWPSIFIPLLQISSLTILPFSLLSYWPKINHSG